MNRFFVLLLGCCLLTGLPLFAADEELDARYFKVQFTYPLSLYSSPEVSWLTVLVCRRPSEECSPLSNRIAPKDLLQGQTLNASVEKTGVLKISVGSATSPILLGSVTRVDNWFPPVELCSATDDQAQCHLSVTRNSDRKTLKLRFVNGPRSAS